MSKKDFIKLIESLEIDEVTSIDIYYTDYKYCIQDKPKRHLEWTKG